MPSRRFHSKSRHGCVQCKKRRVKCDIVRPICGNCARRKEKCHYVIGPHCPATVSWTPPRTLDADPGSSSPAGGGWLDGSQSISRATSNCVGSPVYHLSPTPDLLLLERFVSDVSPTLSHRPDTQKAWAVDVGCLPTLRPDASYLSHILIGISALHVSLTQPALTPAERREYRDMGLYHQSAALTRMQPVLSTLKQDSSQVVGLFGAALLVFLFDVSLPRRQVDRKDWVIDEIVKLSELAKGVVVVISTYRASCSSNDEEARSMMMAGPLRRFLGHFLPQRQQKLSPAVRRERLPQTLQRILALIEADQSLPAARKQLYGDAIDELALTIVALAFNPRHPAIVYMWLISARRPFMELVAERDLYALRIFRAYGVWASQMDGKVWYARRWGRTVVEAVDATLGRCKS